MKTIVLFLFLMLHTVLVEAQSFTSTQLKGQWECTDKSGYKQISIEFTDSFYIEKVSLSLNGIRHEYISTVPYYLSKEEKTSFNPAMVGKVGKGIYIVVQNSDSSNNKYIVVSKIKSLSNDILTIQHEIYSSVMLIGGAYTLSYKKITK